ncbi:MAG: rod shape-determining protein MreC [Fusicatenibacter sp.]|nr:rod shape-determining protein MreC [Fusicatenibacter sp.]
MNKKKKFQLRSKHLLFIMSFFCISVIVLGAAEKMPVTPIREVAGFVIVPLQNGVNQVGSYLSDCLSGFQSVQKLSQENEELERQIKELTEENNRLALGQEELERLQDLYELDQSYSEYEKVAAQVISKDPGNWYSTFVINKGSNAGIQKDMNVIADGGLVGIVTEVNSNSATVRSIIDDSSSVSAMTASTQDNCIVTGDLRLMDEGKLAFSQMNTNDTVAVGEKIVTSNISEKYLKGILIGYISEVTEDSNHLTNKGYIIPVVDFQHISEVLVIKELKQQGGE